MRQGLIVLCLFCSAVLSVSATEKECHCFDRELPDQIAGVTVGRLFTEIKDAPILYIAIDEIVVSNDLVNVSGTLSGITNRTFRINPVMFRNALSRIVLFRDEDDLLFRMVADEEFLVVDYISRSQVYGLRKLTAGGGLAVKFAYEYKGFPSASKFMVNRNDMNSVSQFKRENKVQYCIKTAVCVMYDDVNYDLPDVDESYVNISGGGKCMMRVKK